MTQITVKQIKVIGEGDNNFGHWVNRVITFDKKLKIFNPEDGTLRGEFATGSTMDEIGGALKPGSVIDAACEIDKTGKYLNLKKVALIGGSDTAQTHQKPQQPEQARQPDAFNREASIERQVAAKIAFEHGINEEDETPWSALKALTQAEQIYQWIHSGTLPKPTPNAPEAPKTPDVAENKAILKEEIFLGAVKATEWGKALLPKTIIRELQVSGLKISALSDIKDYDEAFKVLEKEHQVGK